MGYFLGVDLGTTYTAAATRRGGHTEIAALSDRSSMVPSVLFLRDDDTILVGEAANRRGVSEPGRVAREFKRRFGDSAPLLLGGTPYGADILTARLLRWVVDRVAEREGTPPEQVAVTHPANWGHYKLDLLRQAVRHADLDHDAVTISEPQAAATWYATQERVEPGEVVAVYDLGGGTFDAAVLRRTDDGFAVLGSPEGVERLGGIDFDAAVLAHVAGVLGPSWDALDPDEPAARAAVSRLRQECVEAKEALSSDNQVSIPVVLPSIHTEVRLTRAELEAMVRPALAETLAVLRRALRSAGVEADEVAKVLLVGGSSRIPLVSEVVGAALGRPIAVDAHPKNAIALGAAFAAANAAAAAGGTDPSPSGVVPVVAVAAEPGLSGEPATPAGPDGAAADADPRPPVVVPAPPTPRRAPPPAPPLRRPPAAPSRNPGARPCGAGAGGARAGGPSGQHRPSTSGQRPAASGGRSGRSVVAIAALVVMSIALVGVAGAILLQPDDDAGTTTTTTTDSTTTTSEPPPELDADDNGRLDAPGAPPGHVEPAPATAAPEVRTLNHGVHDGFERVSIGFTGDLPPTAELHRDPDHGLLRLTFPEVDPSGAVDGEAITGLFEESALGLSAFLVVDAEGDAFVDVHADVPVTAQHVRLITESGTPVIAIDIEEAATGGTWNPIPVDADGGVILEPIDGSPLLGSTSLYIEAYGRRDMGYGTVEVLDSSGGIVNQWTVTVPAPQLANGFFGLDASFPEALAPGNYTIRFSGIAADGEGTSIDSTFVIE